jgi:hypothetical protein
MSFGGYSERKRGQTFTLLLRTVAVLQRIHGAPTPFAGKKLFYADKNVKFSVKPFSKGLQSAEAAPLLALRRGRNP